MQACLEGAQGHVDHVNGLLGEACGARDRLSGTVAQLAAELETAQKEAAAAAELAERLAECRACLQVRFLCTSAVLVKCDNFFFHQPPHRAFEGEEKLNDLRTPIFGLEH